MTTMFQRLIGTLPAAALALAVVVGTATTASAKSLQSGWRLVGSNVEEYTIGTSAAETHRGKKSGYIKSTGLNFQGNGALEQVIPADAFQGQRVRFVAHAKTEGVQQRAAINLGYTTADGQRHMIDCATKTPLQGSSDWSAYETTVDVPAGAQTVVITVDLQGRGVVYINDVDLQIVPRATANTGFTLEFN